jgi:hypothetical protein
MRYTFMMLQHCSFWSLAVYADGTTQHNDLSQMCWFHKSHGLQVADISEVLQTASWRLA